MLELTCPRPAYPHPHLDARHGLAAVVAADVPQHALQRLLSHPVVNVETLQVKCARVVGLTRGRCEGDAGCGAHSSGSPGALGALLTLSSDPAPIALRSPRSSAPREASRLAAAAEEDGGRLGKWDVLRLRSRRHAGAGCSAGAATQACPPATPAPPVHPHLRQSVPRRPRAR